VVIKVLLVDDQAPDIHAEILGHYNGFEFTTSRRGEHAVQMVKEGGLDLILMDILLPGMDGLEAIRLIRRFDSVTPIIAMTGSKRITRPMVIRAGANDLFAKPFHYQRLYQRIVELLAEVTADQIQKRQGHEDINELKRRRLHLLQAQAALHGQDAPPAVLIEIENLERELR
jgi:DNA-binding response OmpR family regulator